MYSAYHDHHSLTTSRQTPAIAVIISTCTVSRPRWSWCRLRRLCRIVDRVGLFMAMFYEFALGSADRSTTLILRWIGGAIHDTNTTLDRRSDPRHWERSTTLPSFSNAPARRTFDLDRW